MFDLPRRARWTPRRVHRRAAGDRPRRPQPRCARRRRAATASARRARSTSSPRCASSARGARCWPAAPTSACGSTSSCATCGDIIYVGEVDELQAHRATRRRHAAHRRRRLAGGRPGPRWPQRCPALTEMWLRFASPPIRNAGTMGGNVANGSPIGDRAPVLIALDAQRRAAPAATARARCRSTDFYLDYMKNRLRARRVRRRRSTCRWPRRGATALRAYKISKRFDCDISAVCAGLAIALDGGTRDATCASPSAAWRRSSSARRRPRPRCAASPGARRRCDAAQAALAQDFTPLTDMRASAALPHAASRRTCCAASGSRRGTNAPLAAAALSVWRCRMRRPHRRQPR